MKFNILPLQPSGIVLAPKWAAWFREDWGEKKGKYVLASSKARGKDGFEFNFGFPYLRAKLAVGLKSNKKEIHYKSSRFFSSKNCTRSVFIFQDIVGISVKIYITAYRGKKQPASKSRRRWNQDV